MSRATKFINEASGKEVQYLTREGTFTTDYHEADLWSLEPAKDLCLERQDVAMYPDPSGHFLLIKANVPR